MEIIFALLFYLFGVFLIWVIIYSLYASYKIGIKQKREAAVRTYEHHKKYCHEVAEERKAKGISEPTETESEEESSDVSLDEIKEEETQANEQEDTEATNS